MADLVGACFGSVRLGRRGKYRHGLLRPGMAGQVRLGVVAQVMERFGQEVYGLAGVARKGGAGQGLL